MLNESFTDHIEYAIPNKMLTQNFKPQMALWKNWI